MHMLCGLVVAFLALFPATDDVVADMYNRWMTAYEMHLMAQIERNFANEQKQKASEEVAAESDKSADVDKVPRQEDAEVQAVTPSQTPVQDETAICETSSAEVYVEAEKAISTVVYQVDGYIPDEGLQSYLYQRLTEAGIGYFMPYAVCLIAQESDWNPMAENRNGLDKGLLQYRVTYWPTLEWWNPYAEINVFVQQMANRANNGKTVSEMISAHNQSDYGPYCQSYVDAVMGHQIVRIR